jgi:hypothetical protein
MASREQTYRRMLMRCPLSELQDLDPDAMHDIAQGWGIEFDVAMKIAIEVLVLRDPDFTITGEGKIRPTEAE